MDILLSEVRRHVGKHPQDPRQVVDPGFIGHIAVCGLMPDGKGAMNRYSSEEHMRKNRQTIVVVKKEITPKKKMHSRKQQQSREIERNRLAH